MAWMHEKPGEQKKSPKDTEAVPNLAASVKDGTAMASPTYVQESLKPTITIRETELPDSTGLSGHDLSQNLDTRLSAEHPRGKLEENQKNSSESNAAIQGRRGVRMGPGILKVLQLLEPQRFRNATGSTEERGRAKSQDTFQEKQRRRRSPSE